ncbi:MAG: radical SAM protein [Firmicutes bacterium]|nr:radical SAM protein [Bacillota bacterium]
MSKQNYIIPIFVPHKGCPHNCVFCNQKRITGQIHELAKSDVDNQISKYLKTIKKNDVNIEVAFFGGSFTAISEKEQNQYLSIANKYLKNGDINAIRLSTRPDYIDNDILDNLKKFGVSIVELGVQSMDEAVLSASQRGHSIKDTINAINILKEKKFTIGVQLMVGLPNDNKNKCLETTRQVINLKPQFVRIYPALVIKDTYMEYLYESGKYEPLELFEAIDISKEMLINFESNNIKVIRIGLQPTDEMQMGKNVVAGPYHPSFRQLVETEIYKGMIEFVLNLAKVTSDSVVTIISNSKNYSNVIGQKKSNIRYFCKQFPTVAFNYMVDSINKDSIEVNINDDKYSLSKMEYYKGVKKYYD